MKHLRVTTKLWLGVAGIVLGAVLIVGHAGYNSASHQKTFNQQDRLLSQRLEQATQWSALTHTNIVRTQAMLASNDPQAHAEFAAQAAASAQDEERLQQALQASSTGNADQAALQQLSVLQQALQTQRSQALQLHSAGQTEAARSMARHQLRSAAEAYSQALQAYVQQQAQHLAQMRADMGAARQGVVRAAAINMLVLMVGIALGAWLLIGSIRRALAEANAIAERIAAGDLRSAFAPQRHDEFGLLLQSLQRMSQSLSGMIAEVRQSGDALNGASSEIAAGNQDLSQRTEVTASHLQQAAAAMAQLTHTLQDTAHSAQQAADLAQHASGVAQRGGAVVSDVVTTMTDIHSRSQKIADIIGVIDGIAFQTNILALNAAVEAARAGEQGRGFAVVAAEVRTLAQRSAQAAKAIKELIHSSVDRIADGARLVHTAGNTMSELVQSIHRVTTVMQSINTHAAAQSDEVMQMNQAVGALDQMTQQNAALVEESAAAAHSLRAQSEHLRRLVQRFQVPADRLTLPKLAQAPTLATPCAVDPAPRTSTRRTEPLAAQHTPHCPPTLAWADA